MVEKVTIKCAKGSRDMLPSQMAIKEHVFNLIKKIYKQHGAVEIDTPVFERKDILLGKYGEQ
jgi:histidyl-tRNA synthetase